MLQDQLCLLGRDVPACDVGFGTVRRIELVHGAWVDHAQGWLAGHAGLFETLLRNTAWQATEQHIYDRTVETPRLYASVPEGPARDPVLESMRRSLSAHYATDFTRLSLALYRDGRDSVAYHGDRIARTMPDALVATVSIGSPRRFWLRPRTRGEQAARPLAFNLGWGDLLVMGGSCQRTWQHGIPKVAHASPRIAIMFRPAGPDPKD
jgi:alkylated DNA repair dioxygenase AlkB